MLEFFHKDFRQVEAIKKDAGRWEQGEWHQGSGERLACEMIAVPVTPASSRNLPTGVYVSGDMKFYSEGRPALAAGDIIRIDDVSFRVRDIADRSFAGDFCVYYCKRLYEQDGEGKSPDEISG